MAPSGDIKTSWDPGTPEEVAHARETFDLWRGKGYLAYCVLGDGARGEQLTAFDAEARAIILAPPLRGG